MHGGLSKEHFVFGGRKEAEKGTREVVFIIEGNPTVSEIKITRLKYVADCYFYPTMK